MKKTLPLLLLICLSAASLKAQIFSAINQNEIALESKPSSVMFPTGTANFSSDTLKFDDYGGKVGFGICILDGFGMPVRYYFNPKNVVEAGVYLGGVAIRKEDINGDLESIDYRTNFMLGVGYSYFGDRFLKEKKKGNKVRAHGIAVRGDYMLGDFSTAFASLGWAMETFKENRKNQSFIFELGLQAIFPDFIFEGVEYSGVWPGLYLRCHWNFFLK
jgi:opacity protein-like surface antigen